MALLRSIFSALVVVAPATEDPVRKYVVDCAEAFGPCVVSDGTDRVSLRDADDLVFHIDKSILVAAQRERPDLFFLHAAAIGVNGRVVALPAFPGTGKSTLTLALAESGLEYLSDELAPVDLQTLMVEPFPHAICLKSLPPFRSELPQGTLKVNDRFHIPVEALATTTRREALPLAAIVFLRRAAPAVEGLRTLSTASAATCLMAHVLNGLAHPAYGLDAAIALGRAVPCYELDVTDTASAVRQIAAL
jgi:hypothetical protein